MNGIRAILCLFAVTMSSLSFADQSPVKPEINIVFMGKSGVGKSTLINLFYNHLAGQTYDDERQVVIPLLHMRSRKFLVNVEPYKAYNVVLNPAGKSQTEHVHRYSIETDDKIVHLWDAPGVLDVEGVEQDRINTGKIARALGGISVNLVAVVLPHDALVRDSLELRASVTNVRTMLPQTFFQNLIGIVNNSGSIKTQDRPEFQAWFEDVFETKKAGFNGEVNFINGSAFFDALDLDDEEKVSSRASWEKDALVVKKIVGIAARVAPTSGEDALKIHTLQQEMEQKLKTLNSKLATLQAKVLELKGLKVALEKDQERKIANQDYHKKREFEYEQIEQQWHGIFLFFGYYQGVVKIKKKTVEYIDQQQRDEFDAAVIAIMQGGNAIASCEEAMRNLETEQKALIREMKQTQAQREKLAMTTDVDPYIKYLQAQMRIAENSPSLTDEQKSDQINMLKEWIASYRALSGVDYL